MEDKDGKLAIAQLTKERDEAVARADALATSHEGQVAQLTKERDDALELATSAEKARDAATSDHGCIVEQLTAERDAAAERATAAEAAALEHKGQADNLGAALDKATADLAKLKGEAKVQPKSKSAKPRKIGPLEENLLTADHLGPLLDVGVYELVFSDGAHEITALEPITISGPAWEKSAGGIMLREPIHAHGPAKGETPIVVAGFGLLDEKGHQIAWSPLPEPREIAAGSTTEFRRSVIFGAA